MIRFRRFMIGCFGFAAIAYLLAGIPIIPFLLKMNAESANLANPNRGATLTEGLLLILSKLIFLSPFLVGLLCGIAWWTLKTRKLGARLWAIAASSSFLIASAILAFADTYLSHHTPVGHAPAYFEILAGQLFMGFGGLFAFGQENAATSTQIAVTRSSTDAGRSAIKVPDTIAFLLQVGGMFASINVYTRWAWRQGLPLSRGLGWWIQWAIVLVVAVFIHEAAHALVGIGLGMKLRAFIVGPVQFRVAEGRWTFRFRPTQMFTFSGAAGLVPVDPDQSRWNEVTMIAAGPFASLLSGTVAAALAYSAVGSPWEKYWEFFALFATVSLVAGVVNLLPFQPDGMFSDGANILQRFKSGEAADYRRAVNTVMSTLVSPRRPRDFDIDAISRVSAHRKSGESALLLRLWAMQCFVDRGALAEASAALLEAESIYNESASNIPALLHTAFVINSVLLRQDAAAARMWWQRMQEKKLERRSGDYWLAKVAFHWAENDLDSAREAYRAGQAHVAKSPDTGIYNFDRDCYRRMEAILNCPPAGLRIEGGGPAEGLRLGPTSL